MEVYSWENHLFLWAMASMAMLNNQRVSGKKTSSVSKEKEHISEKKHNLVGGIPTPLKNMSSSVGVMTFPIWKNHQGVITSN